MASAGDITLNLDEVALAAMLTGRTGPVYRLVERKCIHAQRLATSLAPVDTGRLQASITYVITHDARGIVGIVGTNVTYALYVELGTYKMAAQPFLRPALDAVSRIL